MWAFGGLRAEDTEPYFQLASGLIIVGMALWMLWRARREQRAAQHFHDEHSHDHRHDGHQRDHGYGHDYWSWALKLLFTVVTLGTGFKGGEVTPLFFIGAALGHALGTLFGAPVDLFAGLGFVAVFAGAANTPLACTIMGIELFGATHAVYIAVACFVAYRDRSEPCRRRC